MTRFGPDPDPVHGPDPVRPPGGLEVAQPSPIYYCAVADGHRDRDRRRTIGRIRWGRTMATIEVHGRGDLQSGSMTRPIIGAPIPIELARSFTTLNEDTNQVYPRDRIVHPESSWTCPVCQGGPLRILGQLSNRWYMRCTSCGLDSWTDDEPIEFQAWDDHPD